MPVRLRPFAYRAFARAVGANLDEVELPLAGYPSFGAFFARRLRDGARVIDPAPSAIIAPCDGVVAARGCAIDHALVQAKGKQYRLDDLVADEDFAARLAGGEYTTIYLSPRDYHRVHAPIDARVVQVDYVPGTLWPVNPKVAARKDGLLARNERVVIHLHSERLGDVAVVMVGAAGVGSIRVAGLETTAYRAAGERRKHETDIVVRRGDELGAFQLGSTVVMIFAPGKARLDGDVGQVVRFGQAIGNASGRSGA